MNKKLGRLKQSREKTSSAHVTGSFSTFFTVSLLCTQAFAVNVSSDRLLTPTQAGQFVHGKVMDAGTLPTGARITRNLVTFSDEGETEKRYVFDVMEQGALALKITGKYDMRTNTPLNQAEEIKVLSPAYKTAEGVGVGMSLTKAMQIYPRSNISYSYVCDCIWLANGLDGIQFHIAKYHYKKSLPTHSDMVALSADDFSSNTTIQHVRIFGEKSQSYGIKDFVGRYKSNAGHLAVVSEQGGKVKLRWKTGSDVYLDNTYDMVLNQDKLISKPTQKEDIKLSVKTRSPKILSLFVDDNLEFEPMREVLKPISKTRIEPPPLEQRRIDDFAGAREEQQIKQIRKVYRSVNDNLKNYTLKKHNSHDAKSSTEGAETALYLEANQFRKIVETFYGEMGKRRLAYYFDAKGQLSFVLETTTDYNAPMYMTKAGEGSEAFDAKKSTISQHRYYFHTDKMIRWLNETNQQVSSKAPRYRKKETDLLGVYTRYQ